MDKKQIERQMFDLDKEILSDLKRNLIEEMNKPGDERDEALIAELNEMIAQTEKELINASKKRSLNNIMKMLDEYEKPKHTKLYKRLCIAAACLLVFLGLNTASMKVFGQNMFSATYQLAKGGITISTEKPENNDIVTSPSDPYGMKAKCAEYGFFPDTPSYIPDGFVLKTVSEESDYRMDSIIFAYRKDDIILNFFYANYKNSDETPPFSLPTETYNVTEEQVNGHTTYILKEDKQFTATYIEKKIKYNIFAEGLDYNECQKILYSLS